MAESTPPMNSSPPLSSSPPSTLRPLPLSLPITLPRTLPLTPIRLSPFLWCQQVEPVIKGHRLHHFLVNPHIPQKFLTLADRDVGRISEPYLAWEQQDQLLLSWLQSSMSKDMLTRVIGCKTSFQLWDKIHSYFHSPSTCLSLKDLLLVPNLTKNLMSVSKFAKDNYVYFVFTPHSCFVKSQDLNKTLLEGKLGEDGLYRFHPSLMKNEIIKVAHKKNSISVLSEPCTFLSTTCTNTVPSAYRQWHLRLGHPHHDALTKALKICNIHIPTVNKISDFCDSCCIAKSHRLPSQPSFYVYSKPLELVFLDVWGPASLESSCGYMYFLTCVDACTRYMWIYLLHRKSDVFSHFLNFKTLVEKQFQTPLKSVQTDGGGEFRPLTSFLQQHGIIHRLTCPHTHHQNGIVERRHRHVVELGLAMLHHASLPLKFWDHAFIPILSIGYHPHQLPINHPISYFIIRILIINF
uniref:Retrovirus-related Pol polyprotein from transposon TNT 1-94 n=1 Tax=Cajanus cajan TaxID=3821 RepID=A0A151RPC2_CAJCA|nr:Retrovirus-related Pol polyprotein from transposon TNT 1-94 [Cajanus cajan]